MKEEITRAHGTQVEDPSAQVEIKASGWSLLTR
jgi:hypothetical protein